jgi:hypothetical protein
MMFKIKKLVLWPKRDEQNPRVVDFELNKVNVITGASRTGKTAIIPIIDYCLASSECTIPIHVIRESVAWYGVIIALSEGEMLIARMAPEGTNSSTKFFVLHEKDIAIPHHIDTPNDVLSNVKNRLDAISHVIMENRGDENNGYDNHISFRDLIHLNFQSQDVVANQSILFFKTHKNEHKQKLIQWFPYILGVESKEKIELQLKLKDIQKELRRLQKELANAQVLSDDWLFELHKQLQYAKEYGILKKNLTKELSQEEAIKYANIVLKTEIPDIFDDDCSEDVKKYANEIDSLRNENRFLNQRLKKIKDVLSCVSDNNSQNKKKIERLSIANWLKDNCVDKSTCPVCGKEGLPSENSTLQLLCSSVAKCEEHVVSELVIPESIDREKKDIQSKIDANKKQLKILEHNYQVAKEFDNNFSKEQKEREDYCKLVGKIESTLDLFSSLKDDSELNERLSLLKDSESECKQKLKELNEKNNLDFILSIIGQKMLGRLQTLDVDSAYVKIAPKFLINDLSIEVPDNKGDWHMLTEIGSASNWVSFHIALSTALQEYFHEQETQSSVPSFIIYDQPSQVYFPKTSRDEVLGDDEKAVQYSSEDDSSAVTKIFKTISDSVTEGLWQAIVLDHAGQELFKDIPNVHLVEEWRNGKKLIPAEWYE